MLVTLAGVGHQFRDNARLFSGLDATLHPGKVYALTGPSGSGKSTLLGILAGWITPTEGSVDRDGVSRVSWVFQNPHGVAGRTALDHVSLPSIARGWSRREAEREAMTLLAEVHLGGVAAQPFRELSGGEAQRLMLARALATDPGLLLVDEPTAQLDAQTALEVIGVLGALSARNCIVAIATHDSRVTSACDDVIRLGNTE